VHDEGERLRIEAPDQLIELADLGLRIRRVAQRPEGELVLRQQRQRRAAGKQENRGQENWGQGRIILR